MQWNIYDHYQTLSTRIKNLGLNTSDKKEILLDLGCGEGKLTDVFNENFNFRLVIGADIKYNKSWGKFKNLNFVVCDGNSLPFKDRSVCTLIEKDALHHSITPEQITEEIKRITQTLIIILEANRYHPVSFIHMTLIRKHEHFPRRQFRKLIKTVFHDQKASIFQMESHVYPTNNVRLLKIVHILEELISKLPIINRFLNYNIAIIRMSQ